MERVEFIKKMRQAVQDNELEIVKQLIKEDKEKLNLVLPTGGWLNLAITHQSWEIMEFLLDEGIDKSILLPSTNGNAISTAAAFGTPKLIEYLMERGYELICECNESNPIFHALSANKIENLKYLLELEKKRINNEEYLNLCELISVEAQKISNTQVMSFMNIQANEPSIHELILDRSIVVDLIKKAIRKFITDVIDAYIGEEVYIVSIEIDQNNYKCYSYVNTKENFNKKVERTNGNNKWYYYFCENEWDIIENAPDYFAEITEYIQKECDYRFDIVELYKVFADAIAELNEENALNSICSQEIIFAFNVYEFCSEEKIIELFKLMNSEDNCKDFIDNIKAFC